MMQHTLLLKGNAPNMSVASSLTQAMLYKAYPNWRDSTTLKYMSKWFLQVCWQSMGRLNGLSGMCRDHFECYRTRDYILTFNKTIHWIRCLFWFGTWTLCTTWNITSLFTQLGELKEGHNKRKTAHNIKQCACHSSVGVQFLCSVFDYLVNLYWELIAKGTPWVK